MYLEETHNTELLPSDSTDTLYVSVLPNEESADCVHNKVLSLGLDSIFASTEFTLYPKDEYHTTLVYSRKNGKQLFDLAKLVSENLEATAKFKGIRILGNMLVIELESESLSSLWKKFIDTGASYDFPDYLPHISIGKFINGATLQSELIVDSLIPILSNHLRDIFVSYDKVSSEPLDCD